MRTGLSLLAVSLLTLAIVCNSGARERDAPPAQVDVSKTAASMPGPRYAWVEMPKQLAAEFDSRVQDPKLRGRLQAALDKALQAKGYRLAKSVSEADIAVAYRVGVRDLQQPVVDDSPSMSAGEAEIRCGGGECSQIVIQNDAGVQMPSIDTIDYVEGGLLIEVLQPGEIRVLWRALYRGSVRAKGARPVDLDAVASQTLRQLPPAPSGAP